MFYDEAKIFIRSGNGGDGMISFRREKYVAFGGPDGGDGGNGGHIIFRVNRKLNSLQRYHRQVHFKAKPGTNGGKTNMTGRRGESLVLEVPPGTILRDFETEAIIADLTEDGKDIVLIEGGEGGRGNARFASSTNQAPKVADRGAEGTERWITMELKLIADVGLVGKPNAGKSTLLSSISSARPKIANYPFTTLAPNLGVVPVGDYESIIIADIPGLIEGAADGVGLGHDFLRHIERTRVIIHLLDGVAPEPLEDFKNINAELKKYSEILIDKPQIVVLNKMDTPDAQAWEPLLREEIEAMGHEFRSISAVSKEGVRELIFRAKQMVDELPEPKLFEEDEFIVIRPEADPNDFRIEKIGPEEWRVHGARIEDIASRTYFEFEETAQRFQRTLDAMGINKALVAAGVEDGHTVWFSDMELEWQAE